VDPGNVLAYSELGRGDGEKDGHTRLATALYRADRQCHQAKSQHTHREYEVYDWWSVSCIVW
jgi:hypothetical protein